MTAVELTRPPHAAVRPAETVRQLAALHARRYARHPLFLLGVLITVLSCVSRPDASTSSYYNALVPAAAIGVLGLGVTATLARTSRTLSGSAGATPVGERHQTLAIALACLLPFTVGLAWFGWAVWAAATWPPPPNGFPFGPVSDPWKLALLFGQGALPTLGGPLLGLVVGRWLPRRGAAPLVAVALVAAVIVMQGLFEPLRRVRVVMPWTQFGGPFGIEGDDMRQALFSGSPEWWVLYLGCLCGLALVAALWHDPAARTARLRAAGGVLLAAAVVTCLLAMWTGIDHMIINPLPSSTGS